MIASLAGATAIAVAGIAGWEQYREHAYNDGVGVQTYGFGTTKGVKPGDRIDPVRAVQRLAEDADAIAKEIGACIGTVPLTEGEWNAYVSLAYNIGARAFCESTIVKLLRQTPPDYAGACKQILRWVKAGGKVLRGLERRREVEYQTCITEGAKP